MRQTALAALLATFLISPAVYAATPLQMDAAGHYLLQVAPDTAPPAVLQQALHWLQPARAKDAGALHAPLAQQSIAARPCYWDGAGPGAKLCDHDAQRAQAQQQAARDAVARRMFAGD